MNFHYVPRGNGHYLEERERLLALENGAQEERDTRTHAEVTPGNDRKSAALFICLPLTLITCASWTQSIGPTILITPVPSLALPWLKISMPGIWGGYLHQTPFLPENIWS